MNKSLEILIVEDDEVDRMIIKRAIKSSGLNIEVSFAEDAESGMLAATGRIYDCIFLDYNLPGGTGLDLLKKIKAEGNPSPIIIVTSHGDENIAVEAMKSGAVDYIPKSLMSGEGLSQSLRHIVRLKQADEEKKKIERTLREAEHRLQTIVSNTPILLFAFDDQGRFTLFEGKGALMLNFDKTRIIGKNMLSYANVFPQVKDIFERTMKGEDVTIVLEINNTFHQAYYTPVKDTVTGKVTGVIGVSYDITGHKKAEVELTNAKTIAEETARLKEQFLANMSHEIRTPMNGIMGLTRILMNMEMSDEQKRYLTSIKTSSEDLMVIIDDILDVSKIEAGKMSFEDTPFNISHVVMHSLELFEAKAAEKGLSLTADIQKEIYDSVTGDPVRLGQILNNLIGNAIKFTSKGQVEVSVKMKVTSEENVSVSFEVKDTGIGIPEKSLPTIFDSFTQASSDTTRKFGGTGLGLTIVKRLIELQGGNIQVRSTENEGTTFSFDLNFNKPESAIATGDLSCDTYLDTDITHLRVLLAEDNPVNRMIVEKIFSDWKIALDCAENGKQVLEKIDRQRYDLILMDIQMPEMDGYAACRQIRQHADETIRSIPVIALTAHALTSEKEKCLNQGMNDYLCKPFDPKQLRRKIIQLTQAGKAIKSIPAIPDKETIMKNMGHKIDLTYLKQISDNSDAFIIEMIEMFLKKTPRALEEMNECFKKQNWDELRMIAHRIKPSFTYIGVTEIQKKLAAIELLSEERNQPEKIEQLIQEVEDSSKWVFGELENQLQILK